MRILHVGKYYPPFRGGMETALQNLAEGQLDAGCEVSLVTAGADSLDVCEVIRGPVTGKCGRLARAAVLGVVNSQPVTPGLVGMLRREVALFSPDVVHLHLPNPLAAAAWIGLVVSGFSTSASLAVWYHADITRQRLGRRLVRPLVAACLSRAAGICVSSQSLVKQSPVLLTHAGKVAVLPFGIAPQPWLDVQPTGDGPFLFVGRLVPYKGVAVLLEALQRVPAASLVIVGEGPEKESLAAQASRLAIRQRVRFVGTLDERGIAGHLARARALVLPSVDASEAFGLVQLEAMGSAVPVVATDLPTGVPEVGVPEETGLLVAPGDVAGLAGAMERLLADPQWAQALGQAGRQRFRQRYTREQMTVKVIAWYGDLLASGPGREAAL